MQFYMAGGVMKTLHDIIAEKNRWQKGISPEGNVD